MQLCKKVLASEIKSTIVPSRKPLHHLAFTPGLCLPPSCLYSVLIQSAGSHWDHKDMGHTGKWKETRLTTLHNHPEMIFTFLSKFTSCQLPQSPGTALPSQIQNYSQLWHHLQLPYFCHQTADPSARLSDLFITARFGSSLPSLDLPEQLSDGQW